VDWNSDGVPDLIFSGARLYKNTGKHLLPEFNEESIRIASGPRASSCVVDWDNDGDFDILYVDQTTYEVQWLENIGTESHPEFKSEGQPVLIGQQPLKTEKLRGTYVAPWGNTVKLCVFDWNGDGKQDLLLGGTNLRVCLNKSQTKGQTPLLDKLVPINELGGQALQFPSSKPIIGLAMGDVDNDGKKDLIISSYSIVNWYRNVGSINVPEFVRAQKIKDLNDGRNTTLQVIDWNRDGLNDILVNRQEGNQPKVRLFSQVPIAELEKPAPSAHAQGANIIIGPYLQNVGTNRIAVCWETDAPANGRVEYGLAAAESKPQVIKTGTNAIRHEVVLNNLQPGQFYNYCVSSGTITSRTSRFTTAPAGPTSFSFVVYSDAQRANYDHVKVIQRITELNPKSFILYCGDQCKFETFIYLAANIFRQVSFFPCIGNTDLSTSKDDKFTDFKQYYALPGNERYYSFDYGQAHFTAVNTFENCKPDSKQYVWLEKDLQLAVQSSLFVFVYFHIPPYSSGTHGQQTASLKLRALQPLFEKYKVDVVFNGHDHAYEHCLVNGVHYIVTGGGSQTRNVGKTKWTVYSEKTLECLLVSVAAQTARIVGVRPDGTKFDCFTIIKQDR